LRTTQAGAAGQCHEQVGIDEKFSCMADSSPMRTGDITIVPAHFLLAPERYGGEA